ncbi:MAG TPA: hypothetical protein DCK98_10700 [Chloroflexi bacterium]|nr:hypothetical protein [Chloroflexota bacterium]HAL26294.1 hypothetical protein [Chloroflexota bacterium]
MSTENLNRITAVLSIHGLGHVGVIGALVTRKLGYVAAADQAGWLAARSWLLPSLASPIATAGHRLLGRLDDRIHRRRLLVLGSARSERGVEDARSPVRRRLDARPRALHRTWPLFNPVAALSVSAAVLVTQLWLGWPARALFGR